MPPGAREESSSERIIQSGWGATCLFPFIPELLLQLSQELGEPRTPTSTVKAQDEWKSG